jgi:hypothetical protein
MVGTWIRFSRDWSTHRAGATMPLQPSLADWLVARGFAAYVVSPVEAEPPQEAAKAAESLPEPSAPADVPTEPAKPEAAARRRGRPPRAQ